MVGTWLAGQRPGPAEPDAGTARPCDIRVEGRSVSGLRPDSLLRCSALGGLLTQPHSVPADGEAGWCWSAAWPAVARSRPAADLYALGQWSAARGPILRAPRAWWDHKVSMGLVGPYPMVGRVSVLAGGSAEHC